MKYIRSRTAAAGVSAVLTALCLTALPPCAVQAAGTVVINEVCTKNSTQPAPDGQYYDYIELYNTGSTEAFVGGYALSDNPEMPLLYVIPDGTVIPAGGFLVVYCGVPEGGAISGATFGLSKDGETVVFSDASGSAIETLEVPALAGDTAFGRIPDGSETFGVLSTLSAGSANQTGDAEISVFAPKFSQESGFYASGFDLTLSAAAGCTVYYTTDGSDPTVNSERYTAPISIYDKSSEANVYAAVTDIAQGYQPPSSPVDKAMIVRAIAVDGSGNVSNIATNSYFIGYTQNDIAMNMRVISLVSDPDNLFDYEKGIYVYGKTYDDWRSSPDYNPMAQSWEWQGNCTQSGRAWERPAHMTVFENGEAAYSAEIGIRIHGGATRSSAQKSFNLYARLDYGAREIAYDFFDGALRDLKGKKIKTFDKLSLRNGGNDDKTKIRDRLNQEMVQDRAYGTQAQTECIVFLDGEFWGTYNIVEKLDDTYISDHYDVKKSSVCMVKTDELEEGTQQGWADYEALKSLAKSGNFANDSDYQKLASMMDLHSFADYMATEVILGNSDFGTNNYALWKTETVDPEKQYADGKWRFILFDTEYGQGLYNQSDANANILQSLQQMANQGEWLPKLFIALMNNDAFLQDFLICYYDQCNENFSADRVRTRLAELKTLYQPSLAATIDRFSWANNGFGGWGGGWGGPGQNQQGDAAASTFTSDLNSAESFWQSRDTRAKQLMLQWLGGRISQQLVTVNIESEKPLQFNTLELAGDTWSGSYPKDVVCSLTAGAGFEQWEITGAELTDGKPTDSAISFLPSAQTVHIKAIYGEGVYTAADAKALLNHLLTKKPFSADAATGYDLDGNGKLTSADLALMKRQISA